MFCHFNFKFLFFMGNGQLSREILSIVFPAIHAVKQPVLLFKPVFVLFQLCRRKVLAPFKKLKLYHSPGKHSNCMKENHEQ